ncbi:MAG: family 43 glycosylhydrolase [Muribaculum sp.]|nr:family 43 glycosylhydrolase [Muribaculum sp.]
MKQIKFVLKIYRQSFCKCATRLRRISYMAISALSITGVIQAATNISTHTDGDNWNTITNDCFWYAVDKTPIYSQGGGVFKFINPVTGKPQYYWYGVEYQEAHTYIEKPDTVYESCTFENVTCYTSDDLVNWKFENNVLTKEELSRHAPHGWVGRMGVAYIPEADIYAMFIQHDDQVLVATCDTPSGEYQWSHKIDMTSRIGTSNTGDQTVFTDPDTGKSYLVYSYGNGRNRQYVSEIGMVDGLPGLLDCHEVCAGESREGNCMFKYKGKYYMVASNIYGWDCSYTYYVTANDIKGPYYPTNDMQVMGGCENDYSHISQTGFFYTLEGTKDTTIIFCGDRWAEFAGNGLGYNQWMPVSFTDSVPHLNSLSSWQLNATTGEWKVANDNNFVKNGSFEADRRTVPLAVKPRQEALTGWITEVVSGNNVKVDDPNSPQLNYFNTADDRKFVIGEKSLNISDKVPFVRKVWQTIESDNFVNIPDGNYTLSASVKHTSGFNQLYMYAESGGKTFKSDLLSSNSSDNWTHIILHNVMVIGDKITVGFYADGNSDASCQIDDVKLILSPFIEKSK